MESLVGSAPDERIIIKKRKRPADSLKPEDGVKPKLKKCIIEAATEETVHAEDKVATSSATNTVSIRELQTDSCSAEPCDNSAINNMMLVGAHVSAAGGVYNAVSNAKSIGCKAFALFLKNQRSWSAKPYGIKDIELFKAACKEHDYMPQQILPHGSYLLNCGSPNPETFIKSCEGLVDELSRCEQLGLTLLNFHPGSTCGKISEEEAIKKVAFCINNALEKTKGVTAVIENTCGQGHTLGGTFEEIKYIIDLVVDKSRVGVCLDTCHAFAAGYNLATEEGYNDMMAQFDKIVGFDFLRGMHLNDSRGKLKSHLDRHEDIGKGKLGIDAFARIMNDKRLRGVPLILETPGGMAVWEQQIKLLYDMQKSDAPDS